MTAPWPWSIYCATQVPQPATAALKGTLFFPNGTKNCTKPPVYSTPVLLKGELREWLHFPKACKQIHCAHTASLTQIPFQEQVPGSAWVEWMESTLPFTTVVIWLQIPHDSWKVRLQCPEAGQEQQFLMMQSHSQWLRNQSEFVSLQTALPIIHHKYLQLGTSQATTHGKHHPIPKTEALKFN